MKKIRVAFFLNLSEEWLGGLNYFRNLFSIITEDKSLNIEPVIFISPISNKNLLRDFPRVDIIETKLLQVWSFNWFISRIICKIFKRDIILENFLCRNDIDVISHLWSDILIKNLPKIAWIPDFQHKYLPNLFSAMELKDRDARFEMLAKTCDCVIVSSYDAKKDFIKFLPKYKKKVKVLQFVVPVARIEYNKDQLRETYKLVGDFFYIPNQFWMHKNHKIVLEALFILKQSNTNIQVVCSGNTTDNRSENHVTLLLEYIKQHRLEENFIILGKIPYRDVQGLAMECKSLINPSLFEGWSTLVEEAKSMGKRIILSDIDVHREQNPDRAVYFMRNNPDDLAKVLMNVWNEKYQNSENLFQDVQIDLNNRKKITRMAYRGILRFAINKDENKEDDL